MEGGVWLVFACPHPCPPPLPLSVLLCVWKADSCGVYLPGFLAEWLLLVWLVGGASRRQEFGRWRVETFLPYPLPALAPHLWLCASIKIVTIPALSGLWFIVSGPFSFTGRKLLVSGCLTIHRCSLNSAHASGSSIFAESLHLCHLCYLPGLWWTQRCPCTDLLLSFMGVLVVGRCFSPKFVTETWWTQRLLSLSSVMTQWSSLTNKGYFGSWHFRPHRASPSSFIRSFWLRLWAAQPLFLTPCHPWNSLDSTCSVLSSTCPACSFF